MSESLKSKLQHFNKFREVKHTIEEFVNLKCAHVSSSSSVGHKSSKCDWSLASPEQAVSNKICWVGVVFNKLLFNQFEICTGGQLMKAECTKPRWHAIAQEESPWTEKRLPLHSSNLHMSSRRRVYAPTGKKQGNSSAPDLLIDSLRCKRPIICSESAARLLFFSCFCVIKIKIDQQSHTPREIKVSGPLPRVADR